MATLKRNDIPLPQRPDGYHMSYLSGGNPSGPLMIFIHGWPGLASTWQPQLTTFASLGFFVVAADTLGYGESTVSKTRSDYSCQNLVADQLTLLSHLGRDKAIWVGHDWGCGPLHTLAAHHPDKCLGVVGMCVPYRTLELGLEELLKLSNREIYPEKEYPYAQWDYQIYYEREPEASTTSFEQGGSKVIKLLFSNGNPSTFGKPSRTSDVIKNGGWFGGQTDKLPDIPLEKTCLTPAIYDELVEKLGQNGWFGATAYYLNHAANREYNLNPPNGGVLEMPVLFVHAKYDGTCATLLPGGEKELMQEQREKCRNLREVVCEAGHWVNLEKAEEVNAAMAKWLVDMKLWPEAKEIRAGKL